MVGDVTLNLVSEMLGLGTTQWNTSSSDGIQASAYQQALRFRTCCLKKKNKKKIKEKNLNWHGGYIQAS